MQPDGNRNVTPNVGDLVEKETEGKRKILDKVQSSIQQKSTLRPAKETKTISGSHMSQATPNPQAKKSSSIDRNQSKNARSAQTQPNTETTKPTPTPLSAKNVKQAKPSNLSKTQPKKKQPNNTQPRKQPQNNFQPSKNKRPNNVEPSNKNQHHTKAKTSTLPSDKTQNKKKPHQKYLAPNIALTPQPTGDATVSDSPGGSSHAPSIPQQETKTKSLDQARSYTEKASQAKETITLIQQAAKGDLDKVEAASQALDTWHAPRTKAALQTGVAIKQCYDGNADVKETAMKVAQHVTDISRRARGVIKLYNGGRDLLNGNARYACYDLVDGATDLIPYISSSKRLALAGARAYNGDVDFSEMTWAGASLLGGPVGEIAEVVYKLWLPPKSKL